MLCDSKKCSQGNQGYKRSEEEENGHCTEADRGGVPVKPPGYSALIPNPSLLQPGKGPAELQPSETPELRLLWLKTGGFYPVELSKMQQPQSSEGPRSWGRWEPREAKLSIPPKAPEQGGPPSSHKGRRHIWDVE